jgi:multisubunit Na+/H+ antiporter MnhB subunit
MNHLIWLFAQKQNADIPKISMSQLVVNGLNIVYFAIGMIAVVMIIMAGYSYMTADGDPGKAQKGLRTIIYCAIGLAVTIFAFAITNFIAGGVE